MTLSRRDALKGSLATGAATLAGCATTPNANITTDTAATQTAPSLKLPLLDRLLFNQPRVQALMEAQKVDLILSGDPVNIYYLTNQRPVSAMLGTNGYVFAAYSAHGNDKPTLIEGQLGHYFTAPPEPAVSLINRNYYGIPSDFEAFLAGDTPQDYADMEGLPAFRPRIHDDHPLSPSEARRQRQMFEEGGPLAAGIEGALYRELTAAKLPNKTVAIDDPTLRPFVERLNPDLRIVNGDRLLKAARLQKTPMELEMMRYVAANNAEAGHAAALTIRDGATFQELRQAFLTNCGQRAMGMQYMMVDNLIPNLTPGEIKAGRSFLIDCVGVFEGYHGDYGRTVCVGEPNARMKPIIAGMSFVWDRLMEALKPGVKYDDVRALSARLIKDLNVDTNLIINPHSVGLHHTDEPSGAEFGYFQKQNLTLQENMVISVDMPLLDTGLGGSAHLEDLVLITKDGPELLNASNDRLIVV